MKKIKQTISSLILNMFLACLFIVTPAQAQGVGPHYEDDWPIIAVTHPTGVIMLDQLEYTTNDGDESLEYEISGWYGGDINRVSLEIEGGQSLDGSEQGELERLDLYYSRLIAPFWEVRGGFGMQSNYGTGEKDERGFAVFGLKGLAPYYFETDANIRVSDDGDVSADIEFEYDMRITQRLILQPQIETKVAFSSAEEFEQGSGINNIKSALRLRYEIRREFAPYIGVSWDKKLGETADMVRDDGGAESNLSFLLGTRMWF